MTQLLSRLFGRIPIGWLQLSHTTGRLLAAISGVAFANLLVFVQLGIQGSMTTASLMPYQLFIPDIIISPSDARTFSDGGNVARQRLFQALAVPGVAGAVPLFIGKVEWQLPDGSTATLEVYGLDPQSQSFVGPRVSEKSRQLVLPNTAIVDALTRGLDRTGLEATGGLAGQAFEFNGVSLSVVDEVSIGGGFSGDGAMFVSDQTFMRLFPRRETGAPNRILVSIEDKVSVAKVAERIQRAIASDAVIVRTQAQAAEADYAYQTTERPTGVIFGFGVIMGVLVGVVIVYQVLSTDVANHLREYATFKAMGYNQRFFLGIVLEQALILAVLGFIPGFIAASLLYMVLRNATGLPVEMETLRALAVFAGTVLSCMASGAVATRRLASADPAELF